MIDEIASIFIHSYLKKNFDSVGPKIVIKSSSLRLYDYINKWPQTK